MGSLVRPALLLLGLFSLLTGLVYPALVTGLAQAAFPHQANGSLWRDGDAVMGSELVGQLFTDSGYFWGRPSVTSPEPYHGAASTGSNLGPSNPALARAIQARLAALRAADPESPTAVPVDLVTASASGLDPHVTPAAAYFQAQRVARARGLPEPLVRQLVESFVEARTFGVLGEPRVNVLKLNLALDRLARAESSRIAGRHPS